MKKILLSVLLLIGLRASAVWIEFKNFDPVLQEELFKYVQDSTKKIVDWQRDYNYGFDKGVSFDGGITVNYTEAPECFGTRKTSAYNLNNEKITIQSIKISPACLALYPNDTNRINAFYNASLHEVVCHALTQSPEHLDWGLCRSALSTDKLYWDKKHRKWLKKNLNINYK